MTTPHIGLVGVPLFARFTPSLGAQPLCQQRGEARLPLADGLVREGEAARQEHLGEVTQAELVAETPEDNEQRDVGRNLQVVERRARALIESATAETAAE